MTKVERIIRAEAEASGAEQTPTITTDHTLPPTINDTDATARLTAAFQRSFGEGSVVDPGMFTGSEDVSWFARESGAPLVFWFWGGVDPETFQKAFAGGTIERDIPDEPLAVLRPGDAADDRPRVENLVVAAREFLG